MLAETFSKVSAEASAERAFDHVTALSQFHRIQASPGFRASAEYCVDRLLTANPDARTIHYPADSAVRFWSLPSFEEWSGKRGLLKIISPASLAGKVADFEACPISLVQRSKATSPRGLTTELVYVGEGKSIKDYRGARGKLAICDSHCPREVYDAALKGGVAGIVLYRHRPLPPLRKGHGVQGVRQYNSFWWNERDLLGFVLTPEEGERIVSYLRSPDAKERPVIVWALVESETYPGQLEVVTSLIPGTKQSEIVVVAHLCHPKPSAGDNASGVAAALESHRILASLIEGGDIPRPRHGIRFLLVPEITGTFAFLSRERTIRKRLLFGLNLDMVGQRQEVTGSTLCIESPPLASPSFTPFLLEDAVKRAFTHGTNPGATGGLWSIRIQPTAFSGGSDHCILSDPTVGVPTPMLLQWPDRYYHTSGDTPDKVSPDVLRRTVVAASTYAYTCAQAAEDDLVWLAALTGRGLRKWIIEAMARPGASDIEVGIDHDYRAQFLLRTANLALRSIGRLHRGSKGLKAALRTELTSVRRCVKQELAVAVASDRRLRPRRRGRRSKITRHEELSVIRLLPGPVDMGAVLMQLGSRRRDRYRRWAAREKKAHMIQMLALYWADGTRSLAEISRLVAAELGYTNPDFIEFYFDLLADAGIVEIVTA